MLLIHDFKYVQATATDDQMPLVGPNLHKHGSQQLRILTIFI